MFVRMMVREALGKRCSLDVTPSTLSRLKHLAVHTSGTRRETPLSPAQCLPDTSCVVPCTAHSRLRALQQKGGEAWRGQAGAGAGAGPDRGSCPALARRGSLQSSGEPRRQPVAGGQTGQWSSAETCAKALAAQNPAGIVWEQN